MVEVDEERAERVRRSIREAAGQVVPPPPVPDEPEAARPPHPRGCFPTEHGLSSIQEHGVRSLTLNQIAHMTAIAHTLEDRGGIRDALRRQAALSLTMIGILVDYLERKSAEGVEVGDLPLTRVLPSYLNACQRLLQALDAMTPKGSAHDAEVKRVQGIVAGAGQAAGEAPEVDDG